MDRAITNENICKISLRSAHRNDRKRRGQCPVNNECINIPVEFGTGRFPVEAGTHCLNPLSEKFRKCSFCGKSGRVSCTLPDLADKLPTSFRRIISRR